MTTTTITAADDARAALEARLTALFHELQQAAAQLPRRGARRRSGLRGVEAINRDIAAVERALGGRA